MQLCSNQDASFNFSHSAGFLHSRRSPQKEARRFAEEIYAQIEEEKAKSTSNSKSSQEKDSLTQTDSAQAPLLIFVIGLGWGYLIEELLAIKSHSLPKAKASQTVKAPKAVEFFFYEPIPEVYQVLKSQGRWEFLGKLSADLNANLSIKLSTQF